MWRISTMCATALAPHRGGMRTLLVPTLVKTTCVAVIATASLVVSAAPAHAQPTTFQFVGLGDGTTWNDQMNWSPQGIPRFGDSVVIKQNPGGPSHVTAAMSTQLATIEIGPGGSLAGQPLVAASVNWSGGTIYNEITALTALQVSGDGTKQLQGTAGESHTGTLIVEDKGIVTGTGELRMNRGTIVNNGEFLSMGARGRSPTSTGTSGSARSARSSTTATSRPPPGRRSISRTSPSRAPPPWVAGSPD